MLLKLNKSNPSSSSTKQPVPVPTMAMAMPVQQPAAPVTYLGPQGYTVLKSSLTPTQQDSIRDTLTISPKTFGAPGTANQVSYPVYRESDAKFFLPKFYGTEIFGIPRQYRLSRGADISLQFNGQLRPEQIPAVEAYFRSCGYPDSAPSVTLVQGSVQPHIPQESTWGIAEVGVGGGGLLELPCGFGKTSISMYIIARLAKKTLVIVHKEFLMRQWIERIRQFLPTARIGTIQGTTFDIDDKDIVIGMLQSLSMKDYASTVFSSFGLVVIDEVHHISSEVFSCALFKIVTPYTLGLSATMKRKDGTSHVFKKFLGEVLFKKEREKTDEVIVHALSFEAPTDDDFNQVETDFRGNTAIAKMITKICEYNARSEFILRVVQDMFAANPNQQMMIIAQYKSILAYLYTALTHRNFASVGYYVGGMKEKALKESEGKSIILATYTMAAEGLDIPTLSTLFMVTPMTNIEQSVGRILRQKHAHAPIVVDIIDPQQNFKGQWQKRRAFFKSQGYRILATTSTAYVPDTSRWSVVYGGLNCKGGKGGKGGKSNKGKCVAQSDGTRSEDTESDEDEVEEDEDENGNPVVATPARCLLIKKKVV